MASPPIILGGAPSGHPVRPTYINALQEMHALGDGMQDKLNIAVFVDYDNIEIGLKSTLRREFDVSRNIKFTTQRGLESNLDVVVIDKHRDVQFILHSIS